MRGDNFLSGFSPVLFVGSPPHAWGQFLDVIIRPHRHAVHPHMRGDNPVVRNFHKNDDGSPPHAWGQSIRLPHKRRIDRFTPTCVGTMLKCLSIPAYEAVHPHMRGDNLVLKQPTTLEAGSPPHAWGQCINITRRTVNGRFTPTCVGTIQLAVLY